jgi:outer membrane protein OmpA-like peptidoglycan-associated protein
MSVHRSSFFKEGLMIRRASVLLVIALFVFACKTTSDDPNARAKRGAGAGAAAGAVVGAVVGNQSGNPRIGHRMDKQQRELQQIPGVEVTRPAENEIAVRMTNDILFDFNRAALRPESQSTLRSLANNFRQYPDEIITVEGHTDNIGSPDYNQGLSERRAHSVRSYLIDEGVPSSHIEARGYGESRPKATNSTPEGRQLNRRVEIHIRATQT